jgi:uncharacterized protein (DUF1697 family)
LDAVEVLSELSPGRKIMAETQYVALLRGINVGGNNIIKMADLRACFENMGLANVATYIQSGNVLFSTTEKDKTSLINTIEKALSESFDYNSRIVLITHQHLKSIVEEAPPGFGQQEDTYRYDVIFLKEPLTAAEAIKSVTTKAGVDTAHQGQAVLYFSRLSSRATQSHIRKIISLPMYQNMTIRNWNTTTALLARLDARAGN